MNAFLVFPAFQNSLSLVNHQLSIVCILKHGNVDKKGHIRLNRQANNGSFESRSQGTWMKPPKFKSGQWKCGPCAARTQGPQTKVRLPPPKTSLVETRGKRVYSYSPGNSRVPKLNVDSLKRKHHMLRLVWLQVGRTGSKHGNIIHLKSIVFNIPCWWDSDIPWSWQVTQPLDER